MRRLGGNGPRVPYQYVAKQGRGLLLSLKLKCETGAQIKTKIGSSVIGVPLETGFGCPSHMEPILRRFKIIRKGNFLSHTRAATAGSQRLGKGLQRWNLFIWVFVLWTAGEGSTLHTMQPIMLAVAGRLGQATEATGMKCCIKRMCSSLI